MFVSSPPPFYTVATTTGQTSKSKLKRLLLKPNNTDSIPSLINDKTSKMFNSNVDALETWNYLRPSNQIVLLLQKGHDFPSYPHELSQSIDEKTWYSRMEDLKKALKVYWSWVEKALFTFAFVASVTVPWPIISAVTRYIDQQDSTNSGDDSDPSSMSSSSATPGSSTSDHASKTASAISSTLTASARFIRRQLDDAATTSSSSPSDASSSDYSSDLADPSGIGSDGDDYWANSAAWGDGYSSEMRWAAIAILLGILVAVWLPWIFVSVRNNRRVSDLINGWNETDEQLGHMRALSWSLNKAPAMSSSKLLMIALPPGMHQQPSVFHSNAYPPSYGFTPSRGSGLPGYPADGVDPYGSAYGDGKGGFMAPPTMFGPPSTGDRKIEEIEDDDTDAATRRRSREEDNDTILEGYTGPGSLNTIAEGNEDGDSASGGRKRSDTASTATSVYTSNTAASIRQNPLERAYSESKAAPATADKNDDIFERMKPIRASTTSCMGATGAPSRPVSSASNGSSGGQKKKLSLNDLRSTDSDKRSSAGSKHDKDAKTGRWV